MSYVTNHPQSNKVTDMRNSNATKAVSAVSSLGPPLRVRSPAALEGPLGPGGGTVAQLFPTRSSPSAYHAISGRVIQIIR